MRQLEFVTLEGAPVSREARKDLAEALRRHERQAKGTRGLPKPRDRGALLVPRQLDDIGIVRAAGHIVHLDAQGRRCDWVEMQLHARAAVAFNGHP